MSLTKEQKKDLFDRTTAQGFHIKSRDWYESYKILSASIEHGSSTRLLLQRYYLIAHGLELAMKGLIRHSDGEHIDYDFIKSFGHNLQKLAEYITNTLQYSLSPQALAAILILNVNYEIKNFEYPLRGSMQIVEFEYVEEAFRQIDAQLSKALYGERASTVD